MTHESLWVPPEAWASVEIRPDPPAELVEADRCDRCGVPALERWENGISELIFCKHHANHYRAALTAAGLILTEAWRLEVTTREVVTEVETKGPYNQVTKPKETDYIRGLTRVREV